MFVKNCGSNQSGSSGIIQSPNYPSPYGNNNYCEWTITSLPGTSITLNINAFSSEYSYDRLFIVRPGTCSPVVPYLTGPSLSLPQSIPVGQNTVSIYFYSDSSVVYNGFSLTWSA